MFIIAVYDQIISGGMKRGLYNENNHGGPCEWIITDKADTVRSIFCLPYNNEKYMYIFSFYDGIENTIMWDKIKDMNIVRANDVPEYVLLTDRKIENFDHNNEYFIGYSDPGVFGGVIHFSIL